MKRGGRVTIFSVLVVLLLVMVLMPLTSASFFSDIWGKITGRATNPVGVNVTIASMNIVSVTPFPSTNNLNSGPFISSELINFSVYNGAGISQINDSTVQVNISINVLGETNRTNATCYRTADTTANYANYSCNISMWWYDTNGTWNITILVRDNNSNVATNLTQTFAVAQTTGFSMSPNNLTWPTMTAGAVNETSNNDPLTMNNTGNKAIGIYASSSNVTVNATHLKGETDSTKTIWANNFSVSAVGNTGICRGASASCFECDTTAGKATNMSFATYTNIANANLTKGNFTMNNNYTGQEQLFFCLRMIDTSLTAQAYSTIGNGSWVIQI